MEEPQEQSQPTEPSSGPPEPARYRGEHEYLQGKSVDEIAEIADKLMRQVAAGVQPAQERAYSPAPQTTSAQPATGPDPDLMYSDAARWQQEFERSLIEKVEGVVGRYAQPFSQQMGSLAQQASENSPNPNVREAWRKYRHEIVDLVTNQVQPGQRTREAWDMAAKIVLSEHLDDVAREKAEKIAANRGSVTEGGQQSSSEGPKVGDALDEFWASDHRAVQRLRNKGLSKQSVRQAAGAMGLAVKDYVEMLKRDNVIHEGNRTFRQVTNG